MPTSEKKILLVIVILMIILLLGLFHKAIAQKKFSGNMTTTKLVLDETTMTVDRDHKVISIHTYNEAIKDSILRQQPQWNRFIPIREVDRRGHRVLSWKLIYTYVNKKDIKGFEYYFDNFTWCVD